MAGKKRLLIENIEEGDLKGLKDFTDEEIIAAGASHLYTTAQNGHLSFLKYYHRKIKKLDSSANYTDYAAKGGHLDVVQFLVSVGCPMTDSGLNWVVEFGKTKEHFHILKFYYERGFCLENYRNLKYPVVNGNLDILKFLVQSGVPLSRIVFKEALGSKNPQIMGYLGTLATGKFGHFREELESAMNAKKSKRYFRKSSPRSPTVNPSEGVSPSKLKLKLLNRNQISSQQKSQLENWELNNGSVKKSPEDKSHSDISPRNSLIRKTPPKPKIQEVLKPGDMCSPTCRQLVSTLQEISPENAQVIAVKQSLQELELSNPSLTSLESINSGEKASRPEISPILKPADALNLKPVPMKRFTPDSSNTDDSMPNNSLITTAHSTPSFESKGATITRRITPNPFVRPVFTPKRSPLSMITTYFSSPEADKTAVDQNSIESDDEELTDEEDSRENNSLKRERDSEFNGERKKESVDLAKSDAEKENISQPKQINFGPAESAAGTDDNDMDITPKRQKMNPQEIELEKLKLDLELTKVKFDQKKQKMQLEMENQLEMARITQENQRIELERTKTLFEMTKTLLGAGISPSELDRYLPKSNSN